MAAAGLSLLSLRSKGLNPMFCRKATVKHIRTGLINGFPIGLSVPQGLKPAFLLALDGTAKAVPYPKPFMRPVLAERPLEGSQLVHP